jgi:hypothetical protein
MNDRDIDLILARKDDIVPSSGFSASVMEAIAREATAPPPIPFPWKRALPGLVWCLVVSIGFLMKSQGSGYNPPPVSGGLDLSALLGAAVWTFAAIAVSVLSVVLSIRLSRRV